MSDPENLVNVVESYLVNTVESYLGTNLDKSKERPWHLTLESFPEPKVRVLVTRRSGKKIIARLDYKPDATFRNGKLLEWLDDNNKFISLTADPVVSWEPFDNY